MYYIQYDQNMEEPVCNGAFDSFCVLTGSDGDLFWNAVVFSFFGRPVQRGNSELTKLNRNSILNGKKTNKHETRMTVTLWDGRSAKNPTTKTTEL